MLRMMARGDVRPVITDLRQAVRTLARWRGGLVIAVLTLAVGIGTTTSLSALVRVMLADFPGVPEIDRVARVYASSPSLGVERAPVSLGEFDRTLSGASSFAAIGAYAQADATVGSAAEPRQITAGYASSGFFAAMGVPPAAGRVFTAADVELSRPVVILSDAIWRRQFPDGRLTGASIVVDGVDREVVGVLPPEFAYGFVGIGADLWVPLARASVGTPPVIQVFARLRPGLDWPAAAAELGAMAVTRAPWTWRAIPIQGDARYRATSARAMTLGPAIVVLLIACVNVSCMLFARGIAREKELSIRRALGATRARVARQLLTEHLLLALAGGAVGCGLAIVLLRVIASAFAAVQPALAARIAIDASLLPVALGSSVLACVLFGALPALRLSRGDVAASLNGVSAARRVHVAGYGARDLVVFLEVGSAVGLIVFAAMLFTLFTAMRLVTPAFPADRVVAMRVPGRDLDVVSARVAAIPGVASVTVASGMPGGRNAGSVVRMQTADGRSIAMSRVAVGAGFFETLGVTMIRGRSFEAGELRGRSDVAVLGESAARALAPSGEAIGLRVRMAGGMPSTVLVIGVCRDVFDYGSLSRAGLIPPDVYVPYETPAMGDAVLFARVATDAHAFLRAIAAAAASPAGAPRPQPAVLADATPVGTPGSGLVVVRMLVGFATLALLLAASGVFGVVSQSVAQRTREFGIRMALGATPGGVLRLVLARETRLLAAALGSGAAVTIGLTHLLFAELLALGAAAPAVWLAVMGLCGGIAAIACAFATWRIIRLEPAGVLRRS
jgi:putative ABC transport system permease protein